MNYKTGIYGFFNEHRFLSNYHLLDVPIRMFGFSYLTVEAAYQAAKSEDREIQMQFSFIVDPKEAKRRGQEIVMREDWAFLKDPIMYEANRQKYDTHRYLREKLVATGDNYLEETNWWGDDYWGRNAPKEDILNKRITEPSGDALNKLGWVLMALRTSSY